MQKKYILICVIILLSVVYVSFTVGQHPPSRENETPDQNLIETEERVQENSTKIPRNTTKTERISERTTKESKPEGVEAELKIGEDWFVEVSEKVGLTGYLDDVDDPPKDWEQPRNYGEKYGNGIYVTDYNTDGKQDIVAIIRYQPVVFRNTGDGFEKKEGVLPDITSPVKSMLFFDYDNDGDDDVYVMSNSGSVFFENTGGQFREEEVALPETYASVRGASAADYTGNGCLDVFVVQAGDWYTKRPQGFNNKNVSLEDDNGNENRLFAGDCESFRETTEKSGISGTGWSLTTSFVDFTNDGYPDIHVANDFNNDVLYVNNGNETFDRRVLPNFTNRNAMSSEVADVNGDGYLDVFVSNIYQNGTTYQNLSYGGRTNGNNLLLNTGNGTFVDVADRYGVRKSAWAWAALMEDFDNDGNLDLYQANSMSRNSQFYFWEGTGETFERINTPSTNQARWTGTGIVSLDYNSDGKLDIAEAAFLPDNRDIYHDVYLYENRRESGNWLSVSVEGDGDHTTIGTRVHVTADSYKEMRVKNSGTDYLSQDTRVLWFGLGDTETVDVDVEFPSSTSKRYEDVRANQHIVVSP